MSDIKLFRLLAGKATELRGDATDLEKPLQTLIEANLDTLLGIRFLATEYSTGKTHAGRIDSLGLDENNCPVILEYKRSVGENVINQGLFYLDWSAVAKSGPGDRSFAEWLPLLSPHLSELVASLEGYVLSLGDDVQRKELKLYVAFKRLKNFASVVPQKNRLLLYLHLDPAQVVPLPGNGRDVGQQGHWGTGDLELALASQADLDAAKPLILMAYEGRGAIAALKALQATES